MERRIGPSEAITLARFGRYCDDEPANCFLMVPADRQDIAAGEKVSVLPRMDVL